MKRFDVLFLAVLVSCSLATVPSFGQLCWGQPPRVSVETPNVLEWRNTVPGQSWLYAGSRLVGAHDQAGGWYRPSTGPGAWGDPCDPPIVPPGVTPVLTYHGPLPTGVVETELAGRERHTFQGLEVSKEFAYQSLGVADPKELVDDSKKNTISVIGPDVERKLSLAELKSKFGDKYRYWEGPADDWSFESGHKAGIYCQRPDGKVVFRQPGLMADAAISAIRKADPSYDPEKDPNGKGSPQNSSGFPTTGHVACMCLAAVFIYLLRRKGSSQ